MDIKIKIQKLKKNQITRLRELNQLFGEVFSDPESYERNLPEDKYLGKILAKEDFIVLVALVDEMVVGGLAAYVLEKFEMQRKEIYIYDLAVKEEFRRKGIARGLIYQLKKIAKEIDAYVIYVQADYGDDPAIQLYESLGSREEVLHFDIGPN
jgi:aminoglycoside 3-N-acetyltransferase I